MSTKAFGQTISIGQTNMKMNTGQTYTLKKLTEIQGKTKMNTGQIDNHEDEHRTWKQEKHKH